jgi:acyl-CoA reductase-like NAD-dependent aldehyde dehydrogenase
VIVFDDVDMATRRSPAPATTTPARTAPPPRCRTAAASKSGYGKDLSMYSVEDYTNIKHVMLNTS